MQHRIPSADLGPQGEGMARAVATCVHCGFCLASCPTYKVLGEEMDSPRGRILLMKQALEGGLRDDQALPYVDRCLGCLACETACPSGVRYRELLVPFRAHAEARARSRAARLARGALLSILESPARFRAAVTMGRLLRTLAPLMPAHARGMLRLLPDLPAAEPLPEHVPAAGTRRARVALLAGCVQRVLRPSINTATLRVLAANGVEVVVPREQGCCGALAMHVGHEARGRRHAVRNANAFRREVDAIITNAAGCGSAMKDEGLAGPVQDVAEFLDAIGLQTAHVLPAPARVAYHDACHLSHGQGIRDAPRRLLARIEQLTLAELGDGELCCGSAGLYNLEQPETAADLGRRKAEAIRATGADLVAAGNIGCITQIEAHLGLPVRHTVEILASTLMP